MPRRLALSIGTVICIQVGCGGATAPSPLPAGYQGEWAGTTMQGTVVQFSVAAGDEVTAFTLAYNVSVACAGTLTNVNLSVPRGCWGQSQSRRAVSRTTIARDVEGGDMCDVGWMGLACRPIAPSSSLARRPPAGLAWARPRRATNQDVLRSVSLYQIVPTSSITCSLTSRCDSGCSAYRIASGISWRGITTCASGRHGAGRAGGGVCAGARGAGPHRGARPPRVGNPSEEEGEAFEPSRCQARWNGFDLHAGLVPHSRLSPLRARPAGPLPR